MGMVLIAIIINILHFLSSAIREESTFAFSTL